MEALSLTPPRNENNFKRPTDVFIDFDVCPSCNALYLITEKNVGCHVCGPGRIAFDEQVRSIYDEMLNKQEESAKLEVADAICKVCNKIH